MSMSRKKEASIELLGSYTDDIGRTTLKRYDDPNYVREENHGLYTGEGLILLKANSLLRQIDKDNFHLMMGSISTGHSGLYSRHPYPFYAQEHHNVSKDEYRGFAYGSAAIGSSSRMRNIVKYGQSNWWFYVDDDPHGGINLDHPGAYRLPTDRALLKITALQKPNIIEIVSFGVSAWLNSRKEPNDTSSKIMSWFGFKAIEFTGYESKILNFFKKKFDNNLRKQYNRSDYINVLIGIYFKDPNHPFHVLSEGLEL